MKKKVTFFEFTEMSLAERAVFVSTNGELIYRKKIGSIQKDIFRIGHFYAFAEYNKERIIEISAFLSISDSIDRVKS
jgi:hypothetical protein